MPEPPRRLATGHEDTQGAHPEGARSPRRLVSAPPASAAQGTARRAHQAAAWALSILWRERQLSKPGTGGASDPAPVDEVASAPKSTRTTPDLGAVQRLSQGAPTSAAQNHGTDLGLVSVRLHNGGAEWWKSPCSVPGGPGWVTNRGTRPPTPRLARLRGTPAQWHVGRWKLCW